MSKKKDKIAAHVKQWHGRGIDPHYVGYFECFNRGEFYEAHDVLEQLWLVDRRGKNGAFYKGLIQFAGAFVHLQKNRLKPAAALFKLAEANFKKYPAHHEHLNMRELEKEITRWLDLLETSGFEKNPLTPATHPKLSGPA